MMKPETADYAEKLRTLERRRYRAECEARCLEAHLTRIDPKEFDWLMTRLEAVQEELRTIFFERCALQSREVSTP